MWPFIKREHFVVAESFYGLTDWHSHILPGVDDGVRDIQESLAILSIYDRLGVKRLWLTPHIMEDIPNTTEHLKSKFEELKLAYQGNVELNLASEYMIDGLLNERIKEKDLITIGPNKDHLLIETSCFNPPMDMYNTIFKIQSMGLYPILAHPERYSYMEKKDYLTLKDKGIKFQLNMFSMDGLYGKAAQLRAKDLKDAYLYDYYGTDLHSIKQLSNF